ncbi:MAG: sigma-70 family RNA polymerase sigma factor [Romboutsia sp.]|nr:sigma-70 family RNA polymerase sigma factor [Romboutsia sp.]
MSQNLLVDDIKNISNVILNAKSGDESAYLHLINILKPSMLSISKQYYLPKCESEDLYQVCLIGLYKGILSFKSELSTNPIQFLKICIKREIFDLIKSATRKKHTSLNDSISMETVLYSNDNSDFTLYDTLSTNSDFLDDILLQKENLKNIKDNINKLTKIEKDIFSLYWDGFSQQEISTSLNLTKKQVDNALQRAKKKMRSFMTEQAV